MYIPLSIIDNIQKPDEVQHLLTLTLFRHDDLISVLKKIASEEHDESRVVCSMRMRTRVEDQD